MFGLGFRYCCDWILQWVVNLVVGFLLNRSSLSIFVIFLFLCYEIIFGLIYLVVIAGGKKIDGIKSDFWLKEIKGLVCDGFRCRCSHHVAESEIGLDLVVVI